MSEKLAGFIVIGKQGAIFLAVLITKGNASIVDKGDGRLSAQNLF